MLKQPQWLHAPTNNVHTKEESSMPTPDWAYPSLAGRRTAYKSSSQQETMPQDNKPAQDCTQHKCQIHRASLICRTPEHHLPANQNSTQVRIDPITLAGLDNCSSTIREKKQLTSPNPFKNGGTTNHGAKPVHPEQ